MWGRPWIIYTVRVIISQDESGRQKEKREWREETGCTSQTLMHRLLVAPLTSCDYHSSDHIDGVGNGGAGGEYED